MSRDLNVDQIKNLWVLNLIIQEGSLRKAALRAKVTPSAISQTLTKLERSVGKPLVYRQKGYCSPTEDAIILLKIVRPAFAIFDNLRKLNSIPIPKMTWLNFGTYESIAINILPGLIVGLREKIPGLKLGVYISRTQQLLTMIRKGELCSALISEVEDLDRFRVRVVADERLGFFVSNKHPIAGLGWRAIKTHGIGALSPGKNGYPRYFSKFLAQMGKNPASIVSDSFEALRSAASTGSIVSVLPLRVARRDDNLKEIFLNDKPPIEPLGCHKLLMVSPSNCDQPEFDFLATEVIRLLKNDNSSL